MFLGFETYFWFRKPLFDSSGAKVTHEFHCVKKYKSAGNWCVSDIAIKYCFSKVTLFYELFSYFLLIINFYLDG